jgi:hypothetical protein
MADGGHVAEESAGPAGQGGEGGGRGSSWLMLRQLGAAAQQLMLRQLGAAVQQLGDGGPGLVAAATTPTAIGGKSGQIEKVPVPYRFILQYTGTVYI